VVFSERTAIADSATSGEPYVAALQGLYSDLLRRGRPLDAVYLESLTPAKLAGYRVLLLPNAHTVTEQEANLLRAWVRGGGTLIATGESFLRDAWGQAFAGDGLPDVFGARRGTMKAGAKSLRMDGIEVP